jgi:uncharacterized protein (DUF111 family)
MNKLYIDPTGGFAGDMFSAALISAGADEKKMIEAMEYAASKIGTANIKTGKTKDGATRLIIDIKHDHNHLPGHDAKHLILHIFEELQIKENFMYFGMVALQNLIDAEIKAHKEHTFLTDHHHGHSHSHGHGHHHHDGPEAFLHEAQDILIDITGAVYGLYLLNAEPQATLTAPISYGGGMITFSHGTLKVPAPATQNMIDKFKLPVKEGPVDFELFTPTGAAILSALSPVLENKPIDDNNSTTGTSRGTKELNIPPLKVCLKE